MNRKLAFIGGSAALILLLLTFPGNGQSQPYTYSSYFGFGDRVICGYDDWGDAIYCDDPYGGYGDYAYGYAYPFVYPFGVYGYYGYPYGHGYYRYPRHRFGYRNHPYFSHRGYGRDRYWGRGRFDGGKGHVWRGGRGGHYAHEGRSHDRSFRRSDFGRSSHGGSLRREGHRGRAFHGGGGSHGRGRHGGHRHGGR